ncbi:unnamed protein product, partial [Lymnaea stagnalis]
LGGSGTVRSRSLSPVRNSLTQTTPAFKQDGTNGDVRPDHANAGLQGARPKATINKRNHGGSSPGSGNVPSHSPKLSGVNGNK